MDWIIWVVLLLVIIAQVTCFMYIWNKIVRREESTRLYLEDQKRILLGCVQSIEHNQTVMVSAIEAAQQSVNAHVATTSTKVGDIWTALREQKTVADSHDVEFRQAMTTVVEGIDTLGGMIRELQSRPVAPPPRLPRSRKNQQAQVAPAADDLPAVPEEGFPVHEPMPIESYGTSQGTR